MAELTIYRLYFTNADCYKRKNIQTQKGIQVHSTGANNPYLKRYVGPDDGRLGQNKYANTHNRPDITTCANAYIGKLDDGTPAIYQTLPWNYRCQLSGRGKKGNANQLGYIGYEMCEDDLSNKDYFEAVVMGLSVKLNAYLCQEFGFGVDMIHDHRELHKMGLASNHGDIYNQLRRYGLTMDDYRAAVQDMINEGVHVTYIDALTDKTDIEEKKEENITMLYAATVTTKSSAYVNIRKTPASNGVSVGKAPRGGTVDVLEKAKIDGQYKIRYDGKEGYMNGQYLVPIQDDAGDDTPVDTKITDNATLVKITDQLVNLVTELKEYLKK